MTDTNLRFYMWRYALYGMLFGLLFPVFATLLETWIEFKELSIHGAYLIQSRQPLLWVIDTAPFVLGVLAAIAGQHYDRLNVLEGEIRHLLTDSEQRNQNLEQIVLDRTIELEQAKSAAEAAAQSKADFLANMSHEIRNPMNAILGFSEALLENTLSKDERSEAITTVVNNGKYLLRIINDILDISKIDANKLLIEKSKFNPKTFFQDINSMVNIQAREKNLEFRINYLSKLPEHIISDEFRLKQILLNLCGNAIKFTNEGSIVVNVQYNDDNHLQVDVIDSGIGMTQEQIENIFTAYTQANKSTTRIYGGTGLGLALSKRLSTMLDAKLMVQSEVEKGSCFTLSIDLNKSRFDENNTKDCAA